jgi:hypothetical protein
LEAASRNDGCSWRPSPEAVGPARNHEVVLEPPGPAGELRLGLEIRADTAAALAVEDRNVDDP